jgi:hypothetical protein
VTAAFKLDTNICVNKPLVFWFMAAPSVKGITDPMVPLLRAVAFDLTAAFAVDEDNALVADTWHGPRPCTSDVSTTEMLG